MTLSKEEYGVKYGKPTSMDIMTGDLKKKEETEEKITCKYNPNIKANTECNETPTRLSVNGDTNSEGNISKSQRRRKRKKLMKHKGSVTKDKLEEFEVENDEEHAEKSEIEKMIEEDLKTTFNETASLISSLSAQSNRHLKPVMKSEAHSTPIVSQISGNVGFGTMFNGKTGSLFGDTQTLDALKVNERQGSTGTKKTVVDAWKGEWLTPENFKSIPKNAAKNSKKKLKNAEESKKDSAVAVITVDKAMQRCMVDMGLRVLTTSSDRQYGGSNGLNGEPIDYIFRCYGCFQFEHNTTRTNCRWCGGQTFQRVAIYEDANGKHHYRYYYRYRYGHRYLDNIS
eukprot:TRINITY_DN232_c0_g1_i1.p1 TRINITY_DN232_c0_g1~~TRINITY_DN232_c0_g1_i1.p1  ORF type:complete len:341 (+),score=112.08 TRINITY_DN232_c0_g1_i1:553-1575(+)